MPRPATIEDTGATCIVCNATVRPQQVPDGSPPEEVEPSKLVVTCDCQTPEGPQVVGD